MNNGDAPDKFQIVWAEDAGAPYIRPIPEASQIGVNDGWASLQTGFPPLNMTPLGAGGIPPFGQDFNGILQWITQAAQWAQAGGPMVYDAAFAAAIGGYPAGAILTAATLDHQWINTVNGNLTDPDAGGAGWVRYGRIRLFADTTFYVATTGNDGNDGRTPGTAWKTLQRAWNVLQQAYDLGGFVATIDVADGAYTAGLTARGPIVGQQGANGVVFLGNFANPALCTVTVNANVCFYADSGAAFTVMGFKLAGTNLSYGLAGNDGGQIRGAALDFGAFPAGTHVAATAGAVVELFADYAISGGAIQHLSASNAAIRYATSPLTVTLTGAPAFSNAFAFIATLGALFGPYSGATAFVGGATGKRYDVRLNGVINTSGAPVGFLPGNAAGSTATGGQYA